ncbi:GLUG motif-containing protein, partial [Caldalkalibacillus salinus]|uniref:GLUG motif-containing protein n=1 Tax=Caldalkalibacillus salinus TaxID=2803787 RepID=UPI0019228C67
MSKKRNIQKVAKRVGHLTLIYTLIISLLFPHSAFAQGGILDTINSRESAAEDETFFVERSWNQPYVVAGDTAEMQISVLPHLPDDPLDEDEEDQNAAVVFTFDRTLDIQHLNQDPDKKAAIKESTMGVIEHIEARGQDVEVGFVSFNDNQPWVTPLTHDYPHLLETFADYMDGNGGQSLPQENNEGVSGIDLAEQLMASSAYTHTYIVHLSAEARDVFTLEEIELYSITLHDEQTVIDDVYGEEETSVHEDVYGEQEESVSDDVYTPGDEEGQGDDTDPDHKASHHYDVQDIATLPSLFNDITGTIIGELLTDLDFSQLQLSIPVPDGVTLAADADVGVVEDNEVIVDLEDIHVEDGVIEPLEVSLPFVFTEAEGIVRFPQATFSYQDRHQETHKIQLPPIEMEVLVPLTDPPVVEMAILGGQAHLSWEEVEGADAYIVERSTVIDSFVQLDYIEETQYIDESFLNGSTTYYYRVKAVNRLGDETTSEVHDYLTPPEEPHLVGYVTPQDSAHVAYLRWQSLDDIDTYTIYRKETGSEEAYRPLATDVTASEFTDTEVEVGSTYAYRIRAHNDSGTSDFSNTVAIDIPITNQDVEDMGLNYLDREEGLITRSLELFEDGESEEETPGPPGRQKLQERQGNEHTDDLTGRNDRNQGIGLGPDIIPGQELREHRPSKQGKPKVRVVTEGDLEFAFAPYELKFSDNEVVNGLPGIVGKAIEIHAGDHPIKQATITMSYTEEELGDIDENDLTIYYVNTEDNRLEEIDDIQIDKENKTVSGVTDHFSMYILGDENMMFEMNDVDFVFVIDQSIDTSVQDAAHKRIDLLRKFVEEMGSVNYRIGIVPYHNEAEEPLDLTNDTQVLNQWADDLEWHAVEPNNVVAGLESGAELFNDENREKIIIHLSSTFEGGLICSDRPTEEWICIDSAEELAKIGQDPDYSLNGKYFQVADIDLSDYQEGAGWQPIGTADKPFTGSLDGNGYTITGLTVNRPLEDYVGLFGYVQYSKLQNINLEYVDVKGQNYVGGLVGYIRNGAEIKSSGAVGEVEGVGHSGGLVGRIYQSNIADSYAVVDVNATGNHIGGAVGSSSNGTIARSYAKGNVTGDQRVGGFIGYIYANSILRNSYATGDTRGNASNGGFIGRVYKATIANSYSVGVGNGGLVGYNYGSGSSYSNNFYDKDTSRSTSTTGATPKTTEEMQTQSTFTEWDFENVWVMEPGQYPQLQTVPEREALTVEEQQISSPEDLDQIRNSLNGNYVLAGDIDLSGYENWEPIGTAVKPFTGSLDGNGYTIKGLTVNRPEEEYVGLFGYAQYSQLQNVNLEYVDIKGQNYVGGLAGYIRN